MKGFRKSVVIGLAVLFTMGLVMAEEKTYTHAFNVTPGKVVVVYEGVDDDVEIRTQDGDKVDFSFYKYIADDAGKKHQEWWGGIKPVVKQDGDTITIKIKYPKRKKFGNFSGKWPKMKLKATLLVPARCSLDVSVVDGDVSVDGVEGKLKFSLVDGDMDFRGCSGLFNLHTVDGDTTITNGKGTLKSRTVDGDIKATGAFDVVYVKSTDGDACITVTEISALAGDWTLGGVDGDLELILPDDLPFNLEAGSVDGDIELEGFSNVKIIKKKKRKLIAEQGDAEYTISMSVVDGDLTIQGK